MAGKAPKKNEPPEKRKVRSPFDFNRDGNISLGEQWIAYQIFQDCTKQEDPMDAFHRYRSPSYLDDDDLFDDDEDGVEEDMSGGVVVEGNDKDDRTIDPKHYPNKRRYLAACILFEEPVARSTVQERVCCQFILDNADTILAANYLSHSGEFLYAKAIKDHFTLPVFLPNEDEQRKRDFHQVLLTIARKDIPLSLEVWRWCLEQFMPYQQYDGCAVSDMTSAVIDQFPCFPKGYMLAFLRAMDRSPEFSKTILEETGKGIGSLPVWIELAMEDGLHTASFTIFRFALAASGKDRSQVTALVEDVLLRLKNYREIESVEYFRDHMLSLIEGSLVGQGKFNAWKADIAEYITEVASLQTNQEGNTRKVQKKTAKR